MPVTRHRSLTRIAHERLAARLTPGCFAVDATAGNGHDTLFLAQQVQSAVRVAAFDIQRQALENTNERLRQAGQVAQVELFHVGHQHMLRELPADWRGKVAAVTFNLGYLPGSDKQTITQADNTLMALDQALQLLEPGGLLSLLVYRGHPGGQEEAAAVAEWLAQHTTGIETEVHESAGPVLYLGTRRR